MPRFANKVDGNQAEILQAPTASGWVVKPTNIMRGKMLDLLAAKRGVTIAVECKMPGETLTESETKFFQDWPGLKILATSGQDAVDKADGLLSHWKR